VTTLRDRTDLIHLEEELGLSKATSNTLRAQTHEFANQLHVIKGLLRGGHTSDAERFIDGVWVSKTQFSTQVSTQVQDAAVAALLIAKVSLAAEHGVDLVVSPGSSLEPLPDRLSHDVTRIVGNLLDNALDAVATATTKVVTIGLQDQFGTVTIRVRDTGPGLPSGDEESIFNQGFSTKASSASGRGFGLALVRLACRRNGGVVRAHNEDGAVFTATVQRSST
jgi:sensor histidine kinase regulating citrate/malate metabolism